MPPKELHGDVTPKRVAIGVAIFLLVIVGGKFVISQMFSSGETSTASRRITDVFEGLRSPSGSDLALQRWYGGAVPTDIDSLNAVAGEFDKWCADHGLNPVKTFEIKEARETGEKGSLGAAIVLVTGTVNDKPFRIRVQRGAALVWVD